LPSQAWEQIELPLFSRGGLLVNLCNTAPLYGDRMVVMIHDAQVFTTPESYSPEFVSWYRFLLPRIGQRADRVLTVSNFSRQQLHAHGICPLEKIEVIPNGIDHLDRSAPDIGLLEHLQLKPGSYVLALASTQQHKNTNVLLKAFSSGRLKGLTLVLFGEATESALRENGYSAPPGTVFTGPVSDGALRGLMAHALCFACPSKTEGFGLPPLEAMTQGCPAIVAPCGALPEACGDAALYADPSDATAWQDAILTLAENPELRQDYATRGRAQASRFTWAAAAKRLADVVTTLA
jgi:glycosyltransferase involved in cell wall biosynthesis